MDTTKKIKKDLEHYMNLPWTYTIETAQESGSLIYIIRVNKLPGVATDAPTIEEAMRLVREAMRGLFEMYREDGEEIPEPDHILRYKGKITYRTSQERHYLLMREAQKRDQSLSQIIDSLVDNALIKVHG